MTVLLANILAGLAQALGMLINLLMVLVGIRVVISWVNPDPSNTLVRILVGSTDPFLRPLRRYIPSVGGADFTPIVLFMVLIFLEYALIRNLSDYAEILRMSAFR